MEALNELLASLDELQSDPAGTQAILDALGVDEPEHSAVEQAVAKERAIGLAVMRLANSSLYAGQNDAQDLGDAILRIGHSELRKLVVAHQARQVFSKGGKAYGLGGEESWSGALAGAIGSEETARRVGGCDPSRAFTAGLYRDCGKLAIESLPHGDEFTAKLAAAEDGESLLEMEREIVGYDHPTVGAALASLWGLPQVLVDAIRQHHEPPSDEPNRLSDCVHCGDTIAAHLGYGAGNDGMRYKIDSDALERIGVDLATFLDLLCETKTRMAPFYDQTSDQESSQQEAA